MKLKYNTVQFVMRCHRLLRQGMHDMKVWVGVEADGSGSSTTPGKMSGQLDEMSRVAKVSTT